MQLIKPGERNRNKNRQVRRNRFQRQKAQLANSLLPALPYKWEQTLGDVDITAPLPQGTRGKDMIVKINKRSLSVAVKGEPAPIMSGELCKEIKVEDSTWTIRESFFHFL